MHILSKHRFFSQRGFSMLEVLISLVVISVGLLGLAGLQATSLKTNNNAYERTQATILAHDMLDRMQSNISGVMAGHYNNLNLNQAAPSCTGPSGACNNSEMAQLDANQWAAALADILPLGTGRVTGEGVGSQFTILVYWDENRSGSDANSTNSCEFDLTAKLFCLRLVTQL